MTRCPHCGHEWEPLAKLGLTRQQARLMAYINKATADDEEHCPPSFEEMRRAMGLGSRSHIHRLVTALAERGHIRRDPYRARSIVVLP